MPISSNRVPKYCLHRGSGQAYVRLGGDDEYLGKYGTAASRRKYDQRIMEWIASGRKARINPTAITIAEVVLAFRRHAKAYYRTPDGRVGKHAANMDEALRPVLKLYGKTAAAEFGPMRLKAVRERLIEDGHVRSQINRLIGRIKHVFKWAVGNELILPSVHHGLQAVSGLTAGRCGAMESEPVKPVPLEHVEPVLKHVSPQVEAMIRLQLLTAMRPGEVCIMRGTDIDTTGELWVYRPSRHKNQSRGQPREIILGKKAQQIVREFLKPDLQAYLFSPADAEAHRLQLLHAQRKTPMNEGNRPGNNRRRHPKRRPGLVYTESAYYRAIIRGCDAANAPPEELLAPEKSAELKLWKREHRWHPHQLRHTAATEIRKKYGLEAAQAVLGHRSIDATQLYAVRNIELAVKIMAMDG